MIEIPRTTVKNFHIESIRNKIIKLIKRRVLLAKPNIFDTLRDGQPLDNFLFNLFDTDFILDSSQNNLLYCYLLLNEFKITALRNNKENREKSIQSLRELIYYDPRILKLLSGTSVYPTDFDLKNIKNFEKYWNSLFSYIDRFNVEIKEIFDYSDFSELRGAYINSLKIKACPYCNLTELNGNTEVDIDHRLIKSNFPLFALSLWNLVPSCLPCNQRYKNSKSSVISPFFASFKYGPYFRIQFSKNIPSENAADFLNELEICLSNDIPPSLSKNEVYSHKKTFELESRYNSSNIAKNRIFSIYNTARNTPRYLIEDYSELDLDPAKFSNSFFGLFQFKSDEYFNDSQYLSILNKLSFDILEFYFTDHPEINLNRHHHNYSNFGSSRSSHS